MASQEQEIVIPQMIGSEKLNTILIAALKVGADKHDVSFSEIADMAKIVVENISRNYKFLVSMGIAETPKNKGMFKLSPQGMQYAQALDWGKEIDANKTLGQILINQQLSCKIVGYVDMHQPIPRDDLVGQIALFAGISKEPRFVTGINGFIDWLLSSKLIEQNSEGQIIKSSSEVTPAIKSVIVTEQATTPPPTINPVPANVQKDRPLPITININIDENTDIEKVRKILELIKELNSL